MGEVENLRVQWRNGPPAPDLGLYLTDEVRQQPDVLLELVRTDVLERQRVRGVPAWDGHAPPISVEHYEAVIGKPVEPRTALATLLVRAELESVVEKDETAFAEAIAVLDRRFPDDVAAVVALIGGTTAESVPHGRHPESDWAERPSGDPVGDRLGDRPRAHGASTESSAPPTRIGNYRIVDPDRPLGQGGMGTVYRAEQLTPDGRVLREVALKLIRPGLTTPSMQRRFEHEATMLAKLHHPGIATIHEAGTFDLGAGPQPFFAMELVRGQTLTEYATAQALSTRARLTLIARVCEAVQHAHQKGVIHRDLKPGNILVTDEGDPKVLDFGVARATDADVQTTSLRTDIGELIGTIPYMSPEQAGGNPDDLDTRSDVYAIGVITFELLSGRLPHELRRKMIHEAVRVIREDEPARLSSINRTLRGDVEIIVGRALEKEKQRRYQSPNDLGSDIARYLANEPIVARPPSAAYQLSKFARRNKALVAGVGVVVAILVAAVIGLSTMYLHAERARAAEAEQRRIADAAEAMAKSREAETARIAEFQEAQLASIDVPVMGSHLRTELLDRWRSRLELRGLDEDEIAARAVALEDALHGIGFTGLILDVIGEGIFERTREAIDEQFGDQPLPRARLLQATATTMHAVGLSERALDAQSVALDLRRSHLGDDDVDTIASLHNVGVIMARLARHEEARRALEDAVAARARILGAEHLDTLASMYELANLLRDGGEFERASGLFATVLDGRRSALGDGHADTLMAIAGAGTTLWAQRKLDEALPLLSEAAEGLLRELGELAPDTMAAQNNLAMAFMLLGRRTEAEALLERLETRLRNELGDRHPHTLMVLNNLGTTYFYMDELDLAARYGREATVGRMQIFGADHPETAQSTRTLLMALHFLGHRQRGAGELDAAIASWSESLELFEDGFAHESDFPQELEVAKGVLRQALAERGTELLDARSFADAEVHLVTAHEMYNDALGPTNVETCWVVDQIVRLYDEWHEVDPAAGHDVTAAEWRERSDRKIEADSIAD